MTKTLVLCSAPAILAAAILSAAAHATPIAIPNNSFESPDAHTFAGVTTKLDSWTTSGDVPFNTGGGAASSASGAFPNVNPDTTVNFLNAHLNQVAYIFTRASGHLDPLGNDPFDPSLRATVEQILPSTFEAGQKYTLTLAVGLATRTPDATDPLEIALFYFDPANPSARTRVATHTIYNDLAHGLSGSLLTDISVTSPILDPLDPAVGKQIGILIQSAAAGDLTATAGRQYDFDNVRIDAVPEPATLSLLALPAAGLLRRRRA